MQANHYGCRVDSEVPIVGVVLNTEPEFLVEDAQGGIDIDWEEYVSSCESEKEIEEVGMDWDQGTLIIGYVESQVVPKMTMMVNPMAIAAGKKAFVPDPDAQYQAIVGETYTQVLWSRFVQRSSLCSPCYPGQGDLDTPPGDAYGYTAGFLAYTLPPEVWGDRMDWRSVTTLMF